MSILEGLGDIRHTEDSEPFARNMDYHNEMMNKRAMMDWWIQLRNMFAAEYRSAGLISVENFGGIHLRVETFIDLFPEHNIKPWDVADSEYKEHLTAQYKGVTFFAIR